MRQKQKVIKRVQGKDQKRSISLNERKKKEDRLRKKLKEAEREIGLLRERLLRTAAELDNYRKRTEREISQVVQYANGGLIKDILPVIDDLERSLKVPQKKAGTKEFHRGVELIYLKLISVLGGHGLKQMESTGKPFNVELHDALMQLKKEGMEAGMVVEEHEKGYYFKDKVLRHAKVVVSK
jgi:molecular chaperone GrpE